MYQKKKDGLRYDPATGRTWEHKGYAVRIYWNPTMLSYLQRNYDTTLNEELAEWLGVSMRTVIRKARELGLEKDPAWLTTVWEKRRKWAQMAHRHKGYPGIFQKGQHNNPAGEFKHGHQESEYTKAKRAASIKAWCLTHPDKVRERAKKAWKTRRNSS